MNLTELARAALLGVRNVAPAVPATGDAEADALAARLVPPDAPEAGLLRQAALLALAERAGQVPVRPDIPDYVPCPDDPAPVLPEAAAAILHRVLGGHLPEVLPILLDETARRGFRLPPALLPELLDLGRKPDQRRRVVDLACARARWLAAQNPDWAYLPAPEPPEVTFATGQPAARRAALREWRGRDPAAARAALAAGWPKEPPNERAGLLEALAEGLSAADEEFLESALNDRRKEVRKAAAALLARLPDSRLVARMRERAVACVRLEQNRLIVEPPAEYGRDLERDGIDPDSDVSGLGQRAAWLMRILAAVPPAEWRGRFELPLPRLLGLAAEHEFGSAVRLGLARATEKFHDVGCAGDWLAAEAEAEAGFSPEFLRHVAPVLAGTPELERRAVALLRAGSAAAASLLALVPAPWSEDLAGAWLESRRDPARYATGGADPSGRRLLFDELGPALARLPPRPDGAQGWDPVVEVLPRLGQKNLNDFLSALRLRIRFIRSLETP
jgi:hypothetical protein